MLIPLRPCPFCGTLPTLEFHAADAVSGQEYLLQHAVGDERCVARNLFVLAASAEECGQQWNGRNVAEDQWQAVLDALVVTLLRGKADAARTLLRRAINQDKGSDADTLSAYWNCWLTTTTITTIAPTLITTADLFTRTNG